MNSDQIRDVVWKAVQEAAEKGPGWSQESVVLRDVRARLAQAGGFGLDLEQAILDAWHDLFTERKLSWGYNLENPGSPFFHIRSKRHLSEAGTSA